MENPVLKSDLEVIVIPDECGDTMWDAVLKQEINASDVKVISSLTGDLLQKMEKPQVTATTGG